MINNGCSAGEKPNNTQNVKVNEIVDAINRISFEVQHLGREMVRLINDIRDQEREIKLPRNWWVTGPAIGARNIRMEQITIEDMELSVRSTNVLRLYGARTLADVAAIDFKKARFSGLGKLSIKEIIEAVNSFRRKVEDGG